MDYNMILMGFHGVYGIFTVNTINTMEKSGMSRDFHGDFPWWFLNVGSWNRGIFSASKMVSYSTEMGDGTIVGHQPTENGEKFG